jgi:hypothetical protein
MIESVISYLGENRDIISNVRSFSWTINKLRKVIDEIKRKEKVLSSDILEKTIQSAKVKDELIFSLIPISTALFNYAKEIDDLPLKAKVKMGQSYFVRLRDTELLDKSEMLRIIALNVLPQLKKYSISMNTLHNLRLKIDEFKGALGNKVVSLISSSTVMEMNELFLEAEKFLKQMDSFVEVIGDDFPDFYDEYLEVRSVENYDAKKTLMELEGEDDGDE